MATEYAIMGQGFCEASGTYPAKINPSAPQGYFSSCIITLSQIRVNLYPRSCFICFVYVKVPQCRKEDVDQNVPKTSNFLQQ